MGLSVRTIEPHTLSEELLASMYTLLCENFVGVRQAVFLRDLLDKDIAFLLTDEAGVLQGFSTAEVFSYSFKNRRYRVIFSGDTIIAPKAWGSAALPVAWLSWALTEVSCAPDEQLLWFLISKGIRTYKFLPTFCRDFYPSYTKPGSVPEQELIYRIASYKFGSNFDASRGVLRQFDGSYALMPELAEVSVSQSKNPHVKYFLEMNPLYRKGEELVCCAFLKPSNIRPFLLRNVKARVARSMDDAA